MTLTKDVNNVLYLEIVCYSQCYKPSNQERWQHQLRPIFVFCHPIKDFPNYAAFLLWSYYLSDNITYLWAAVWARLLKYFCPFSTQWFMKFGMEPNIYWPTMYLCSSTTKVFIVFILVTNIKVKQILAVQQFSARNCKRTS